MRFACASALDRTAFAHSPVSLLVLVCCTVFKNFELTARGQTIQSLIDEVGGAKNVNFDKAKELAAAGHQQDFFNRVILPMVQAASDGDGA